MRRRALLAGAGAALLGFASGAATTRPARVIRVVARKFVFVPEVIALRRGEPVILEFTAPEVLMGFNAPGLKLRADIPPGAPVRVPLTPNEAGSFPFLCDVFCGSGHENMTGTISVS